MLNHAGLILEQGESLRIAYKERAEELRAEASDCRGAFAKFCRPVKVHQSTPDGTTTMLCINRPNFVHGPPGMQRGLRVIHFC